MNSLTRKMKIIGRCNLAYREKHSSDDLSGIYYSYVFAICKHPGWSQDKLAKHMCISKSNVTRYLAFLEEKGYIERKTGEHDKREMLVYPTQKMLDILPEVTSVAREWNEKLTENISEEELALFMKVLDKMADRAREIVYGEGDFE